MLWDFRGFLKAEGAGGQKYLGQGSGTDNAPRAHKFRVSLSPMESFQYLLCGNEVDVVDSGTVLSMLLKIHHFPVVFLTLCSWGRHRGGFGG